MDKAVEAAEAVLRLAEGAQADYIALFGENEIDYHSGYYDGTISGVLWVLDTLRNLRDGKVPQ